MLRRTLFLSALAATVAPAWAQTTAQDANEPAPPALQEYAPSNSLERAFIAAYRNEQMRPAFRRQFLESNVLVVMASTASDAPPLLRTLQGEDRAALIFTSGVLLDRRLGPATPRVALTGRAALRRLAQNHVVINFGYAPMLMLDPPGIAGFLDIPATPDSAGPSQ